MGREEKKKPAEKSGQRRVHERGIEERLGGRRRGGGGRRRREAWRADMAEEAVEEIEGSWSGDKRAPELPASLPPEYGRGSEGERGNSRDRRRARELLATVSNKREETRREEGDSGERPYLERRGRAVVPPLSTFSLFFLDSSRKWGV